MPYSVFVSYSSQDLPAVNLLQACLKGVVGLDLFVAENSLPPGASMSEQILHRIRMCDMFIVFWSQNAKESAWVSQEIGAARASGKLVIPVMLERGLSLPGFLAGLKYLKAFGTMKEALSWLRTHVATRAQKKANRSTLMGIGGALLLLAGFAATEK
jgi:hypothetical protein